MHVLHTHYLTYKSIVLYHTILCEFMISTLCCAVPYIVYVAPVLYRKHSRKIYQNIFNAYECQVSVLLGTFNMIGVFVNVLHEYRNKTRYFLA